MLFLDEAPELASASLQALRQPLESGRVVLSRARGTTVYPAQVQLVLAANPCPCASPAGDHACVCSPVQRRRYLGRISGPLLDRIDIQIKLTPLSAAQLMTASTPAEPSAVVAERVAKARAAAAARWSAGGWRMNAEVPGPQLRRPPWRLRAADTAALRQGLDRGTLSARGFDRVLRLLSMSSLQTCKPSHISGSARIALAKSWAWTANGRMPTAWPGPAVGGS